MIGISVLKINPASWRENQFKFHAIIIWRSYVKNQYVQNNFSSTPLRRRLRAKIFAIKMQFYCE